MLLKKVLLVDDNEKNIESFSNFFKAQFPDWEVVIIKKPEEMQPMVVAQHKPGLFIINYFIQNVEVKNILAEVNKSNEKIFTFLISKDLQDNELDTVISLGVDEVINRPFDFEIILSQLKSMLTNNYVSSLSFFCKAYPLAQAKFVITAQLLSINEATVQLKTNYMISVGAYFDLKLAGLKVPLKVIDNQNESEFECKIVASVLIDLMKQSDKELLRKAIYELGK